jgi:hypothetical protein
MYDLRVPQVKRVMMLSTKAGGLGLNLTGTYIVVVSIVIIVIIYYLTGANIVVVIDPNWNPRCVFCQFDAFNLSAQCRAVSANSLIFRFQLGSASTRPRVSLGPKKRCHRIQIHRRRDNRRISASKADIQAATAGVLRAKKSPAVLSFESFRCVATL